MGNIMLQGVTKGYRGLHKGLQRVTRGYKGLQGVTRGYMGYVYIITKIVI